MDQLLQTDRSVRVLHKRDFVFQTFLFSRIESCKGVEVRSKKHEIGKKYCLYLEEICHQIFRTQTLLMIVFLKLSKKGGWNVLSVTT